MRLAGTLLITALAISVHAVELPTGPPSAMMALKPDTLAAFNQYVRAAEKKMDDRISNGKFLAIDSQPQEQRDRAYDRLRAGEVLIEHEPSPGVAGGLIHDWIGTAFIPGTTLRQAIDLLEDYNNYQTIYSPEVVQSRLLDHKGDEFNVALRLRQHKVITVVLNTEYEVHFAAAPDHASVRSYSTRIAEVKDPGEAGERELPPGNDHGFLWRIDTYWQLVEKDGGVYAQCEAISLTRNVPTGLGWIVGPFIESIPRESLLFTLNSTRSALIHKNGKTTPQTHAKPIGGE